MTYSESIWPKPFKKSIFTMKNKNLGGLLTLYISPGDLRTGLTSLGRFSSELRKFI